MKIRSCAGGRGAVTSRRGDGARRPRGEYAATHLLLQRQGHLLPVRAHDREFLRGLLHRRRPERRHRPSQYSRRRPRRRGRGQDQSTCPHHPSSSTDRTGRRQPGQMEPRPGYVSWAHAWPSVRWKDTLRSGRRRAAACRRKKRRGCHRARGRRRATPPVSPPGRATFPPHPVSARERVARSRRRPLLRGACVATRRRARWGRRALVAPRRAEIGGRRRGPAVGGDLR